MSARNLPATGTATREDLIRALTERGLKRDASVAMVSAFLDVIADSLVDGEDVQLRGFGRFSVATKTARPVRDLRSGDSMLLPSRRTVTFRPSAGLRTRISAALCCDAEGRQV